MPFPDPLLDPPVAAYVFTSRIAVERVLSALGVLHLIDDNAGGTEDGTEADAITEAIYEASAEVAGYCRSGYDPQQLYASWRVRRWTTIIAVYYLSTRRGNPGPKSIKDQYERTLEQLVEVYAGGMDIGDIPKRVSSMPGYSNVTYDPLYSGQPIRVQRQSSDRTQRDVMPAVDWYDEFVTPYEP